MLVFAGMIAVKATQKLGAGAPAFVASATQNEKVTSLVTMFSAPLIVGVAQKFPAVQTGLTKAHSNAMVKVTTQSHMTSPGKRALMVEHIVLTSCKSRSLPAVSALRDTTSRPLVSSEAASPRMPALSAKTVENAKREIQTAAKKELWSFIVAG